MPAGHALLPVLLLEHQRPALGKHCPPSSCGQAGRDVRLAQGHRQALLTVRPYRDAAPVPGEQPEEHREQQEQVPPERPEPLAEPLAWVQVLAPQPRERGREPVE